MKSEPDKNEGDKALGAAFEVYHERGYGIAEEIYQECFEIEPKLRGIQFQSKQELVCSYKGRVLRKRYIPDLFVFSFLVVELKAVIQLALEHAAQLLNYLRLTRQAVGYLLNFGHKDTLEWKRFIMAGFILPSASAPISVPS